MVAFLLLLMAGPLAAAQEKSKWQRVYTYEDAVIEMEVINLSFGNFGRVRFRTVYEKSKSLRESPTVKYKSQVEDVELMCAEREYRITETLFLNARGKVVRAFKADDPEGWRVVRSGGMMEKLLVPACRMIAKKKL